MFPIESNPLVVENASFGISAADITASKNLTDPDGIN